MTITTGLTNSFRKELLEGVHDFTADEIRCALYSAAADIGPSTTAYTATNEASGTGYTAGGAVAAVADGYPALSGGTVAEVRFDDIEWDEVSVTFRGLMLYNASKSNKSILIVDKGESVTVVSGLLRIRVLPGEAAPITIT